MLSFSGFCFRSEAATRRTSPKLASAWSAAAFYPSSRNATSRHQCNSFSTARCRRTNRPSSAESPRAGGVIVSPSRDES
jgi:hypothetical protein